MEPGSKLRRTVQMLAFFRLAGNEIDDLVLCAKFVLQDGHVNFLDIASFLRSHRSGNSGGVAGDHPDTFEAQCAEGDVGETGGAWDKEIGAFR